MRRPLNEAQQRAATTTEGPLLIIAGPGSGKTHTLVERVLHLITARGVPPEQILVSTFTEKAAAELVTRVSSRLTDAGTSIDLSEMFIGTLHSLCLRLLDAHREHTRLQRNYTVLDPFDQQYQILLSLSAYRKIEGAELILGPPESGGWTQAETLVRWINRLSEELITVERLLADPDPRLPALGRLYAHYQAWLERENALDLSSIQVEAWSLLQNPSVRDALRAKVRYLMVDEYQDTNTVQEAILLLLAGGHQNLCVVGDDDQSLYRFRGASVRNILEFPKSFPETSCSQVWLRRNYRSHPDIIRFFNTWMGSLDWSEDGVSFRYPKQMEPAPGAFQEGPAVLRVGCGGGADAWHAEVLAFLRHLRERGILSDYNQVAFLFRSVKNRGVVALARFLEASGVPVYSPRSNLFFEREEVQRLIGALIFLFPQLNAALRECWPADAEAPEIWGWYEDCLAQFVGEVRSPEHADLLRWARHRARDHAGLGAPTDYAFSGLFYSLLQFPMFNRYLGAEALGGARDSRPARNLALLSRLITRFEHLHRVSVLTPDHLAPTLRRLFNHYLRFLYEGGLDEFEDDRESAPSGAVSFMTVHQAKGLEFPVVIVGSLESVPRKQSTELDELLQARIYRKPPFEPTERTKHFDFWRLYYTAFSRAQSLLVLSAPENLDGRGRKVPSEPFRALYGALSPWRSALTALDGLMLAPIREVDLKRRYSFTAHVAVYERCARQYKFFKELAFSPVRSGAILFGTLVHQTIEDVHRAALRGEPELVQSAWLEERLRANYRQLAARERRYLPEHSLRSAAEQVQRYVDFVRRTYASWEHIQAAEVDVSLVRDTYILDGSVDLIQGVGDTVEVVDLKGERKPDLAGDRERITRYKRQLEIYGFLIEQRLGRTVSRLHLHYTGESTGNPRISWPMDPASVRRTMDVFDQTVARIEARNFEIEERPKRLCVDCDMRHYCDRL